MKMLTAPLPNPFHRTSRRTISSLSLLFAALMCFTFSAVSQTAPPEPPDPAYDPPPASDDPNDPVPAGGTVQAGASETILSTRPKEEEKANLDFQTDLFTGQFRYSIPLRAVPARQGSEPKLALTYRSTIENSFCGVGWTVALPQILRESKNDVPFKWQNGQALSEYDDTLGFVAEFGGTRVKLIKISSQQPLEYAAENCQQFTRFFYHQTETEPYWEIRAKDGTVYRLGQQSSNRGENPNWAGTVAAQKTFQWAASQIVDRNGNETRVTYEKQSNVLYPKTINYNGNVSSSPPFEPNNSITFNYDENIPTRLDQPLSYRTGFEVKTTRLLTSIVMKCGTQRARKYSLTYVASPSTGKSLLTTVTEFGKDDTKSFPVIALQYQQTLNSFAGTSTWQSRSGAGFGNIIDIDGDGLADLVYRGAKIGGQYQDFQVQSNNATAWEMTERSYPGLASLNPANDNWNRPQWTRTSSSGEETWMDVGTLDMDGDGGPDRIEFDQNTGNWRWQKNTKIPSSGFTSGTSWGPLLSVGTSGFLKRPGYSKLFSIYYPEISQSIYYQPMRTRIFDINGDGLPDRITAAGGAATSWQVQLNTGSGFGDLRTWTGVYSGLGTQLGGLENVIDFNGDGLIDRWVADLQNLDPLHLDQYNNRPAFQLNQGATFGGYNAIYRPWSRLYQADVTMVDMNGDGLVDWVSGNVAGPNSTRIWKVRLNRGSDFTDPVDWSLPTVSSSTAAMIDVNGDGLVDRVFRVDGNPTYPFRVALNNGPYPDLLKEVSNGMGGKLQIVYQCATKFNNRDEYGRALLSRPVWAVTSTTVTDGLGGSSTTSYAYSGGMYDSSRHEFCGFHSCAVTSPSLSISTNYFHQGGGRDGGARGEFQDSGSVTKRGTPYRIETWGHDSKLYSIVLNKVEETRVHPNGVYFPHISQTLQLDYEGAANDSAPYRATGKRFTYETTADNYPGSTGNRSTEETLGEVASVNFATHACVVIGPELFTYWGYITLGDIRDRPNLVFVYDATTILRETDVTYDTRGNLLTSQMWHDTTYVTVDSSNYDEYGNLTNNVDAKGVRTGIVYDGSKSLPVSRRLGSDQFVTKYVYDPLSFKLVLSVDPNGVVSSNYFDPLFRVVESSVSTIPNGPTMVWKTKSEYALDGIVNGQISGNYVRTRINDDTADGIGIETYVYQDGLGRAIQTRAESERAAPENFRVSNVRFDPSGNPRFVSQTYFANGAGFTPLNGTYGGQFTTYDPIGRISQIYPVRELTFVPSSPNGTEGSFVGDTGSASGFETIQYKDGSQLWAKVTTDAEGKVKRFHSDAYGRVYKILESDGVGTYQTQYAYDLVGNLIRVTNHLGHVTQIEYDSLGNKTRLVDPDAGEWLYRYDAAGRLMSQRDPVNNLIDFTYSGYLGQLTDKDVFAANGQYFVGWTSLQYDVQFYPQPLIRGLLGFMGDETAAESYTYDFRGRLLKKTLVINESQEAFETEMTYDTADRLREFQYPNNAARIRYSYDNAGNPTRVENIYGVPAPAGQKLYEATLFNEDGNVRTITWGSSLQTTRSYYAKTRRLQGLNTTKPGGGYHQDLAYTYDKVANLKSLVNGVGGYTGTASATLNNIQYDGLHRLLSYDRDGATTSFSYDSIGNIVNNGELGGPQYQYWSSQPHAVTYANWQVYGYDAAGNMTSRPGQTLTYDQQNRLIQVNSVTYGYTDDGRRVLRRASDGSIQNVWIDDVYEREGTRILFHISLGGQRIASFYPSGELFYYHQDHLGSSTLLTDGRAGYLGNLLQHSEFAAYGTTRSSSGTTAVTSRYTGHTFDADTGLYFCQSRYYDPTLGRFIQPDTLVPSVGNPQTLDRYGYCLSNPLKYVDPSGHSALDLWNPPGGNGFVNAVGDTLASFGNAWDSGIADVQRRWRDLQEFTEYQSRFSDTPRLTPERFITTVLDLTPVVGAVKSYSQMMSGTEWFTGERVSAASQAAATLLNVATFGVASAELAGTRLATRGALSLETAVAKGAAREAAEAVAKSGEQPLFRAVTASELASIQSLKRFSVVSGSSTPIPGVQGKWFYGRLEDARRWASLAAARDGGPLTIVRTTIPAPLSPAYSQQWVDGIKNPAMFYRLENLNGPITIIPPQMR